jgi:hypothetical protein
VARRAHFYASGEFDLGDGDRRGIHRVA